VSGNPLGASDSTGLAEEALSIPIAIPSLTTACLTNPAACGVGLAGAGGYAAGTLLYSHIEEPLSKVVDWCMSNSADSPFWQGLKPYRGKTKTNGESGKRRRYFEWDHTDGDIEVYDGRGNHLGSASPETGEQTKPAVPGRRIDL